MIKREMQIIRLAVIVLCLTVEFCFAVKADGAFFAGVNLLYHDRVGYLFLSDGKKEAVSRKEVPGFGVILGKRFRLPKFRLQIPLLLDYGRVSESASESFDATVKTTLSHAGLTPELQLPLRISSDAAFYLSAGFGIHAVRFTEKTFDGFLFSSNCPSFSINGGVGFEAMTAINSGIAVQYSIRYGKPVYYKYMKDLFPFKPVSYKEKIITHSIQFMILLGK